jgi:hypothetical protein
MAPPIGPDGAGASGPSDADVAYVARVRDEAAALAVTPGPSGLVRDALTGLRQRARIDVDTPVAAHPPSKRLLQQAVKRSVGWYVYAIGQQVSELGASITLVGAALADRVDLLDGEVARLRAEVGALAARLEGLERAGRP